MIERRVIPIRASSFGTLLDCGYRFEGEQLLGIRKKSSLRAHLGTSIHAGTAAYDQARIDGEPISIDDAAGVMIDKFTDPDDVDLRDDKLTLREAERIALALLSRYCRDIAPKVAYASVEMPLQPLDIDCGGGLIIRLTGTMDRARVVMTMAGKIIADIKTGGRLISPEGVVSIKARAAQLGIYQILSEHTDGEQTEGAQIIALQTTTSAQVGISQIFDAKAMMLGDDVTPGLLEIAAGLFRAGLFPPNPSSPLCSKKYCARWDTCRYHE